MSIQQATPYSSIARPIGTTGGSTFVGGTTGTTSIHHRHTENTVVTSSTLGGSNVMASPTYTATRAVGGGNTYQQQGTTIGAGTTSIGGTRYLGTGTTGTTYGTNGRISGTTTYGGASPVITSGQNFGRPISSISPGVITGSSTYQPTSSFTGINATARPIGSTGYVTGSTYGPTSTQFGTIGQASPVFTTGRPIGSTQVLPTPSFTPSQPLQGSTVQSGQNPFSSLGRVPVGQSQQATTITGTIGGSQTGIQSQVGARASLEEEDEEDEDQLEDRRFTEDSARTLARILFARYDENRIGNLNSAETASLITDFYCSLNIDHPSSRREGLDFMVANDINNDGEFSVKDFEDIFVLHLSTGSNDKGYKLFGPRKVQAVQQEFQQERTTTSHAVGTSSTQGQAVVGAGVPQQQQPSQQEQHFQGQHQPQGIVPPQGSQQPGSGFQQPGSGFQQPGSGFQQPGSGFQQPGSGFQQGFSQGQERGLDAGRQQGQLDGSQAGRGFQDGVNTGRQHGIQDAQHISGGVSNFGQQSAHQTFSHPPQGGNQSGFASQGHQHFSQEAYERGRREGLQKGLLDAQQQGPVFDHISAEEGRKLGFHQGLIDGQRKGDEAHGISNTLFHQIHFAPSTLWNSGAHHHHHNHHHHQSQYSGQIGVHTHSFQAVGHQGTQSQLGQSGLQGPQNQFGHGPHGLQSQQGQQGQQQYPHGHHGPHGPHHHGHPVQQHPHSQHGSHDHSEHGHHPHIGPHGHGHHVHHQQIGHHHQQTSQGPQQQQGSTGHVGSQEHVVDQPNAARLSQQSQQKHQTTHGAQDQSHVLQSEIEKIEDALKHNPNLVIEKSVTVTETTVTTHLKPGVPAETEKTSFTTHETHVIAPERKNSNVSR